MAKKKTQLDKMIEKLDQDIEVLQAARARIVAERDAAAAKRRPVTTTSTDTSAALIPATVASAGN